MFRKYVFILILCIISCDTANYLAVIEVSEGRRIVINGKFEYIENLADAILYIAQQRKIDSNQVQKANIKVELSPNTTVGIVNEIKKELAKVGISNIDYYTFDGSKAKHRMPEF